MAVPVSGNPIGPWLWLTYHFPWNSVNRSTDETYSTVARAADATYSPITRASDDSWNPVNRSTS